MAARSLYENDKFLTNQDLVKIADAMRVSVETGGIVAGGVPIDTSERAQAKYEAAMTRLQSHQRESVTAIFSDGTPGAVDLAALQGIVSAVEAHIVACYQAYAAVWADIKSGAVTTRFEVISHPAWPKNG